MPTTRPAVAAEAAPARSTAPAVEVAAHDEQSDGPDAEPVDLDRWRGLMAAVLQDEGHAGECTLVFASTGAMADLNRQHMGGTGPTDVLAFPIDEAPPAGAVAPRLIGDVVVCPAVARANAEARGRAVDDELALLVVHGALHLVGWDHATPEETEAMQARERHHLSDRA